MYPSSSGHRGSYERGAGNASTSWPVRVLTGIRSWNCWAGRYQLMPKYRISQETKDIVRNLLALVRYHSVPHPPKIGGSAAAMTYYSSRDVDWTQWQP